MLIVRLVYALEVLLRVVNKERRSEFEIGWPTANEMRSSAELLERSRELGGLLKEVLGGVDGVCLP